LGALVAHGPARHVLTRMAEAYARNHRKSAVVGVIVA